MNDSVEAKSSKKLHCPILYVHQHASAAAAGLAPTSVPSAQPPIQVLKAFAKVSAPQPQPEVPTFGTGVVIKDSSRQQQHTSLLYQRLAPLPNVLTSAQPWECSWAGLHYRQWAHERT